MRRRTDDHRGLAVGEKVRELGVGMRGMQRHCEAADAPTREHRDHEVVSGLAQQRDARAVDAGAVGVERAGEQCSVIRERRVAPDAAGIDDGGPVRVLLDARAERRHRNRSSESAGHARSSRA